MNQLDLLKETIEVKKKILVISQYFYPENFRINDICSEWIKIGYEVKVITGIPNYPFGRFFEGYGLFKRRSETINGVSITRLPITPRGTNSLSLVLNYLSFVVSGFFWSIFTNEEADLVFIFEVSPMTQALPGVWYSKKRKIPCHIYVQDLWPENVQMIAGINNRFIINSIGKMVDYIYRNTEKIFTTSRGFVNSIHKRGVPLDKIEYLPQYAEDFYVPVEKKSIPEIQLDDSFKITFTGNIGYAQGLSILPKVANFLLKNSSLDFRFIIVGDGRYKTELIKSISSMNLDHVFQFIDSQPPQRINEFLAVSDCAFLSLSEQPLFSITIPAKLQTYMACAMPIIATASGEIMSIICESGAGLCSEPNNVEELAMNILKLSELSESNRREMSIKSRLYYDENFSKEVFLGRLESIFNQHDSGGEYV